MKYFQYICIIKNDIDMKRSFLSLQVVLLTVLTAQALTAMKKV
jgi:hypothetical protein